MATERLCVLQLRCGTYLKSFLGHFDWAIWNLLADSGINQNQVNMEVALMRSIKLMDQWNIGTLYSTVGYNQI